MLGSIAAIWISMMLIIVLVMLFAVSSIVSSISGNSSMVKIEKGTILSLNLNTEIVDRATAPTFYDIINERQQPESLTDITSALAAAKDDKNIEGLYIKCGGASLPVATAEAVRTAIEDFRKSGKWVVAYSDTYSQTEYYIASLADEIYLNPVGSLDIHGLASGIPFFKGLLDKVGVEMQVVKVGTFKSAVEPFILTSMSEANRLQTHVYLDNIWNNMVDAISASRSIDKALINQYADSLTTMTEVSNLIDLKLIDGVKYRNELSDLLKAKVDIDEDDDLPLVSIADYIGSGVELPHEKSEKHKIAVYFASGDITESGRDGIASDRVVPDILSIAEDDDIDALVLRVNSGGGSAFASEQIWHALEVLKENGKPFYVSMGDYAASGGYYISCGADKIFAQPMTLTGSIGIFGMIPCAKELVHDKLGVNVDYVSTNANSIGISILEPMTPFMRNKMQESVNRGYELFTSRCAEGRHMSQDSIKAIAEGRVWDGATAKRIGLVDVLGTLDDAVEALAKDYDYKKYQVIAYPDPKSTIWDVLTNLNSQMKVEAVKTELGIYYPTYRRLKELGEMDPVQARMEEMMVK